MTSKGFAAIIIVIIIAVLAIGGGVVAFNYFINQASPKLETKAAAPNTTDKNPMAKFDAAFTANDYKITASGKFEYSTKDAKHEESMKLGFDNKVLFTKKGSVVKVTGVPGGDAVLKDSNIYITDSVKKTYTRFSSTNSLGQWYLMAAKASFSLISLNEDTKKGVVSWQKNPDNSWEADWNWTTPFKKDALPIKVKISLDPATNLATTLSMKFNPSDPWQDANFKYEKIDNIENLLIIPPDYKEERLPTSALVSSPTATTENKKSTSGGSCVIGSDCLSGTCVHVKSGGVCTEKKNGDPCFLGMNCASDHCVNEVCTAGKAGDKCAKVFDCETGLKCTSGLCN